MCLSAVTGTELFSNLLSTEEKCTPPSQSLLWCCCCHITSFPSVSWGPGSRPGVSAPAQSPCSSPGSLLQSWSPCFSPGVPTPARGLCCSPCSLPACRTPCSTQQPTLAPISLLSPCKDPVSRAYSKKPLQVWFGFTNLK